MDINVSLALSFLIGGLLSFLIMYVNQKSKKRSFLENINKLETEKQIAIQEKNTAIVQLTNRFNRDLDKQKREFTVQIETKKYKYESKKNEYYQFIAYLDVFNRVQMNLLHNDLLPAVTSSYQVTEKDYKRVPQEKSIEFNNKCLQISSKLSEQQRMLFSQVDTLKLSANEETMQVISELVAEIQVITTHFHHFLEKLCSPNFQIDNVFVDELLAKGQNEQDKMMLLRENLLMVMKVDLNKL